LRTKEGVEVDFIVHLGDARAVAIEVKSTLAGYTPQQARVLDSLGLEWVGRWTVVRGSLPEGADALGAFGIEELFERLTEARSR
jgi:hypothetical protein